MKTKDLFFEYPEELVAKEPQNPTRVMFCDQQGPQEISLKELLALFKPGDALVINNSKVLKRRVFAGEVEILFLASDESRTQWQVLFPSKKYALGAKIELPLGYQMTLTQKGRPQTVQISAALGEDYFEKVAELPLPPYIQKARQERHNRQEDQAWYQTDWAKKPGSFAAPTASLHFSKADLEGLRQKGVQIFEVTLHVGLGTFLPVVVEDLNQHEMHEEYFEIPHGTYSSLQELRQKGGRVWVLGTTAARAIESGRTEALSGWTKILIQPGYSWKWVDVLMTNFHQPESTLLAMVAGFAGLQRVQKNYQWAIQQGMRLFSYGDLSVWLGPFTSQEKENHGP